MVTDSTILDQCRLGEWLSHHDAYQNLPSTVKSINEADNITRDYSVLPLMSRSEQVIGRIYVPTGSNVQRKIYVVFTGTHNIATVLSDLEPCPGEYSFMKSKSYIMHEITQAIKAVVKTQGGPVTLAFAGHSLGGGLAQQALTDTLRHCAFNLYEDLEKELSITTNPTQKLKYLASMGNLIETEKHYFQSFIEKYPSSLIEDDIRHGLIGEISKKRRAILRRVKQLEIYTMNAVGISKFVEQYSNQAFSVLHQYGLHVTARYGMVAGDAIQCVGEGSALSKSTQADVSVIKFFKVEEGYKKKLDRALLYGFCGFLIGWCIGSPFISVWLAFFMMAAVPFKPTLIAHTSYFFPHADQTLPVYQPNAAYKIYRNTTEQQMVTEELQHKSSVLNSSLMQKTKSWLYYYGLSLANHSSKNQSQPISNSDIRLKP